MDNILTPYSHTTSFADREVLPDGTIHFKDIWDVVRCVQTHNQHNRVHCCYMVNEKGQKDGPFRQFDQEGNPQFEINYRANEEYGPHTYYRKKGRPITIYRIGKEMMGIGEWKKRTGKTPVQPKIIPVKNERAPIIRPIPVQREISTPPAKIIPRLSEPVVTPQKRASTPFIRSNNPVQISLKDERNCTPYDCIEIFTRCDVRLDGTREYYDRKNIRRCKQLFHENATLRSQIFYDTETGTIPTDRTNFNKNGKLCGIIPYEDGIKHGQEIIVHPSGTIETRYHYKGTDVGTIAAWLKEAENASDIALAVKSESELEAEPEEEVPIGDGLDFYDRMTMSLRMVG
jgi:antitoxin component YwqK of YwqJK toxin-antitoxin module